MIIGIGPHLRLGGRLSPGRHVVIVPCFNLHYILELIYTDMIMKIRVFEILLRMNEK